MSVTVVRYHVRNSCVARSDATISLRSKDLRRAAGLGKDVDVHIARTARLFGAIRQCDGAAERVRKTGGGQCIVNRQQPFGKTAHRRSLSVVGYSSFPGLRYGSSDARSSTCSRIRPALIGSIASGVTPSRTPADS